MAYDNTHLVKLAALKALAEKVKSDYALKADLTALSGRVDNLVAAGGEPNVLTGIKVNGTLLDLTEKIADILIAEGKTNGTNAANGVDDLDHGLAALAYKAEVSETELAKALKDAIDAKAKQADLDTLTGEGEGSIKKMIDDAFNDFSTKVSDDGVVNSYKELIDWAATHGSEATKMAKGISENKTAIANLKKYVGTLPEGATATDVVGYIAEAIAALSIGDYAKTADLLRPGHADYTAYAKYHGFQDARGGGHFSGRITAALVAGGAIVLGALNRAGIDITTHIARCAGISDTPFALDDAAALAAQVSVLESRDEGFALLDASVEEPMKTAIRAAGSEGDSVGGILETAILGLPAGVGEPYFDSVESLISHMAFSVPAVKGIEFGTGFGFADLKGSEANDAFRMKGDSVVTATNHNAGINGGITNGMPVVFRTAVKPTPSIYKEQETVDYIAKQDAPLSIQGRHDPCIVPRAAIVQTCAAALAVGDLMTARYGTAWMERPTSYRREGL